MQKPTLSTRWKNSEPSKKFVFWACVASAVLTMAVGFTWGGWVTGGSARAMSANAVAEARIELASLFCADRFARAADAEAQLGKLRETAQWMRGSYIEKGGWTTPPGATTPVRNAGDRCAEAILNTAGLSKVKN